MNHTANQLPMIGSIHAFTNPQLRTFVVPTSARIMTSLSARSGRRSAAEGAVPGLDHEVKFFRKLAVEAHPLALDDAAFGVARGSADTDR